MGIYQIEKCIFSGLPTQNFESGFDAIEYYVDINGKRHLIRLPYSATEWENNNTFLKKIKIFYIHYLSIISGLTMR